MGRTDRGPPHVRSHSIGLRLLCVCNIRFSSAEGDSTLLIIKVLAQILVILAAVSLGVGSKPISSKAEPPHRLVPVLMPFGRLLVEVFSGQSSPAGRRF